MKKSQVTKAQLEQISTVLGLTEADREALLTSAGEVQTTDPIPLESLRANAAVDSTTETLNDAAFANYSANLSRNGPRDA